MNTPAALLEAFFLTSPDLMMVSGPDARLVRANEAWRALLGLDPAALVGTALIDVVHPEDRATTLAEAARIRAGSGTSRFENRCRHADGSWRWISWSACATGGHLCATGRDVTGENRVLRAFFEASPMWMGLLDADWAAGDIAYVSCNAALARALDRTPPEMVGVTGRQLGVPEQDLIALLACLGEAKATGRPARLERMTVATATARWTLSSFSWYGPAEAGRDRFAIVTEDVTEQRQRDEQLRKHQLELAAAARFKSLGEMAGGIAHEINNPLGIINVKAQVIQHLAREQPPNGARLVEMAHSITDTVARIGGIVNGMRRLSRDGDGEAFELVPVTSLVSDALGLCQERFRSHGIALSTPAVPAELDVECRAVQVSQTLVNLLANAHDAALAGPTPRWVRVEAEAAGDEVRVRVLDSGGGVPEKLRDAIFEPFFTTKEVGSGTGLGLSISRSMVEQQGGTLRLERGDGSTCFTMALPRRRKAG